MLRYFLHYFPIHCGKYCIIAFPHNAHGSFRTWCFGAVFLFSFLANGGNLALDLYLYLTVICSISHGHLQHHIYYSFAPFLGAFAPYSPVLLIDRFWGCY